MTKLSFFILVFIASTSCAQQQKTQNRNHNFAKEDTSPVNNNTTSDPSTSENTSEKSANSAKSTVDTDRPSEESEGIPGYLTDLSLAKITLLDSGLYDISFPVTPLDSNIENRSGIVTSFYRLDTKLLKRRTEDLCDCKIDRWSPNEENALAAGIPEEAYIHLGTATSDQVGDIHFQTKAEPNEFLAVQVGKVKILDLVDAMSSKEPTAGIIELTAEGGHLRVYGFTLDIYSLEAPQLSIMAQYEDLKLECHEAGHIFDLDLSKCDTRIRLVEADFCGTKNPQDLFAKMLSIGESINDTLNHDVMLQTVNEKGFKIDQCGELIDEPGFVIIMSRDDGFFMTDLTFFSFLETEFIEALSNME